MALVLADMETEIKNRMSAMGAFSASASIARMRYAIRKAAFQVWTRQDWDFKNSKLVIATTAGTLGPYDAPTGLVRFATRLKLATFGFADKDILAPINSSDSQEYLPYLTIQDGKIYFVSDPGSASLTLNYLGSFSNAVDDAGLAASLLVFDDGLNDAILELAFGDIVKMLPGKLEEGRERMKDGLFAADAYWEDATRDKWQKTISPKGLNGIPIDFYARTVTILGIPVERFANV